MSQADEFKPTIKPTKLPSIMVDAGREQQVINTSVHTSPASSNFDFSAQQSYNSQATQSHPTSTPVSASAPNISGETRMQKINTLLQNSSSSQGSKNNGASAFVGFIVVGIFVVMGIIGSVAENIDTGTDSDDYLSDSYIDYEGPENKNYEGEIIETPCFSFEVPKGSSYTSAVENDDSCTIYFNEGFTLTTGIINFAPYNSPDRTLDDYVDLYSLKVVEKTTINGVPVVIVENEYVEGSTLYIFWVYKKDIVNESGEKLEAVSFYLDSVRPIDEEINERILNSVTFPE